MSSLRWFDGDEEIRMLNFYLHEKNWTSCSPLKWMGKNWIESTKLSIRAERYYISLDTCSWMGYMVLERSYRSS